MKQGPTASEIGAACVGLGVRKAARQVARRYDDAFRPIGITSGQFSVLAALLREEAMPIGVIAHALGMDRTTLNRNLRPLEDEKLVVSVAAKDDRRVRGLRMTDKGRALLERALPIWREAQADSQRGLAGIGWPKFRSQLELLG